MRIETEVGNNPPSGNYTADTMLNMAQCQMKLKKYDEAFKNLTGLTGSYENGNPKNLSDEFIARCYLESGNCIVLAKG